MAERSWFFAANGQQQGPYPEAQFRDFIARGMIRPDTLVWSEGMAGWQKAGDIPGMVGGAGARPPMMPQGGAVMGGGYGADSGYADGGALSVDLPLWSFFGYCVLLVLGNLVVLPSPWIVTGYYRWLAPRIHVPGRPNLRFTGQVGDIWWAIGGLALTGYLGLVDQRLQLIGVLLQAVFSWILMRWVVSHLSSNGQHLPITFKGSVWGFVGFQVLMVLSVLTIIGWAWVITAWMRWIFRNVEGTRREVVFTGSGLQVLWRTIVLSVLMLLIIPIPWMIRWYSKWFVSQVAVVERGADA